MPNNKTPYNRYLEFFNEDSKTIFGEPITEEQRMEALRKLDSLVEATRQNLNDNTQE